MGGGVVSEDYTVHGSVQTELNPQVLGSVLGEGGLDPHLQVQGPGVSHLDLRFEPGPNDCHG
jgi:hypothetical protein